MLNLKKHVAYAPISLFSEPVIQVMGYAVDEGLVPSAPLMSPPPMLPTIEIAKSSRSILEGAQPNGLSLQDSYKAAAMYQQQGQIFLAVPCLAAVLIHADFKTQSAGNQAKIYHAMAQCNRLSAISSEDLSTKMSSFEIAREYLHRAIDVLETKQGNGFSVITRDSVVYRTWSTEIEKELCRLNSRTGQIDWMPWMDRMAALTAAVPQTREWMEPLFGARHLSLLLAKQSGDLDGMMTIAVETLEVAVDFFQCSVRQGFPFGTNEYRYSVEVIADTLNAIRSTSVPDVQLFVLKRLESGLKGLFSAGVATGSGLEDIPAMQTLRDSIQDLWGRGTLRSGMNELLASTHISVGCGCSVS